MSLFKAKMKEFWSDEGGQTTIELVLVLAALVAVAIIFKGRIKDFIDARLNKVDADFKAFDDR